MKMKDKLKNFFYLEEEDDYVEENVKQQESIQQQAAPAVQRKQVKPAVSRPAVVKKPAVRERAKQVEHSSIPNIVSITQKTSKVILSEPRVYAEAQDIADNLKNKRAVVVNLQRIDREQGLRIIDFLSGTIFALGGDIKRIGTDIFLCTPDNVEVDGNISDYYYEDLQ
ncbi:MULTISPECIES: cell division protein SepF [unclassified Rummeliibacillus]|uniref:cell division protein SepF n=1 Tax=unclassified Rummeliibacillus TaxID=2622809 RepID=UPI000E66A513|nr:MULTISPECIES: cell division protein SepF [unclassified Rummeliibacillus]RIJ69173.1 cell division protein SepF [Rummeliibacillus sp. POC4]RPJ96906.1 cell division protein SepF [Rummeliibacillus sp. TYF005]